MKRGLAVRPRFHIPVTPISHFDCSRTLTARPADEDVDGPADDLRFLPPDEALEFVPCACPLSVQGERVQEAELAFREVDGRPIYLDGQVAGIHPDRSQRDGFCEELRVVVDGEVEHPVYTSDHLVHAGPAENRPLGRTSRENAVVGRDTGVAYDDGPHWFGGAVRFQNPCEVSAADIL
jgi:hypothetical protein